MLFTQQKERTDSRNYAQSVDFDQSSFHVGRQTQPQTQQLGFFQQLQQSIFGSSSFANNQNGHQQSKSFAIGDGSQSIVSTSPGKIAVQIFIDLGFKNYTKHVISDDTTAGEVVKSLKSRYAGNQPSTSTNPTQKGNYIQSYQLGAQNSQSQAELNRSYQNQAMGTQSSQRKMIGNQGAPTKELTQKDEYGLFLINTRAQNPYLFVRKLSQHDLVYRVFYKAMMEFQRKDFDDARFKLVFLRSQEVEQLLRQRTGVQNSILEEENHVVSQLGKSIINNKTYERKGKLYKKSLYTDKFKERQFVLDKDQLFYYKNEKQKDKNFNLIMLSNAQIHILENFGRQFKYVFQIENENRKYILSTKSQYDLEQWVFAIQGQIRLSKDNKNIADVNQSIMMIEKEIAQNDMLLLQKIFKPKNIIFNPVQPILLDFVNDPLINELLPNLTKYMHLVREKEYQRQAFEKAKDIVQKINTLQKKLKNQLGNQNKDEKINLNESSITDQIEIAILQNSIPEDYKRYKDLKPEEKIQCLFSQEDVAQIEEEFSKYLAQQQQSIEDQNSQPAIQLNPKIFNPILMKINRIIKYNFMDEFFEKKKIELLSIPFVNFKMNMTNMEFNATGQSLQQKGNKNVNIFESMLTKKNNQKQTGGERSLQYLPQTQIQLDQNFQLQVKNFIGTLSQDGQKNVVLGSQQD